MKNTNKFKCDTCDVCSAVIDRTDAGAGFGELMVMLPNADGCFVNKAKFMLCELCAGRMLQTKHEIEAEKITVNCAKCGSSFITDGIHTCCSVCTKELQKVLA